MPPIKPAPTPPSLVEKIMHHPYAIVGTTIALNLALGSTIVTLRSGVTPQVTNTWSAAGSIFSSMNRTTNAPGTQRPVPGQNASDLDTIPLPKYEDLSSEDAALELENLLALLATPAQPGTGGENSLGSAYSFIPQGLISIETTTKRSSEEDALYEYGNAVGTEVQSFENTYRNAAAILDAHARDRNNTEKAERVRKLGVAYAELGVAILAINSIPAEATSFHSAYGTTYRILGTNIINIAKATTDEEYVAAVNTYNESSDNLTKRFLGLVTLFVSNNVTFSSSDAGSIFMFGGEGSF